MEGEIVFPPPPTFLCLLIPFLSSSLFLRRDRLSVVPPPPLLCTPVYTSFHPRVVGGGGGPPRDGMDRRSGPSSSSTSHLSPLFFSRFGFRRSHSPAGKQGRRRLLYGLAIGNGRNAYASTYGGLWEINRLFRSVFLESGLEVSWNLEWSVSSAGKKRNCRDVGDGASRRVGRRQNEEIM